MAAAVMASWPRRARPAALMLPVAYGILSLLIVAATRAPLDIGPTTYAGASRVAYTANLVAGLALLGAAALALANTGTARIGVLAFAAGLLWFAPDWEGWAGGSPSVRSLGAAAAPLLAAPLTALVAGRLRVRRLVWFGITVLVAAAVARALVRDPLRDPYCWRDCLSRTFVVHADSSLARDLDRVWEATTIALALVAVPVVFARPRRMKSPILIPGALALAALAAYAALLLRRPQEDPRDAVYATLFYGRTVAFTALGAGVVLAVVLVRRQRANVARLANELSNAPQQGRLGQTLSATFGDPTLEVAYWLPRAGHFVDTSGAPVEPSKHADGRAVTPIVRGGSPVAVVVHDPALLEESFERELGSAARLAVENERLQAEVRAQLNALRDSRLRIIARGDAERRHLERDLHDGAQQRLLALGYDLRLARAAAAADGNKRLAAELITAAEETQAALEDLRLLAHGIYPAILAEAGLSAALATLADESPLAVELGPVLDERLDPAVEAALYVAVRDAIDDAVQRGATWVEVALEGRVRLEVVDDGAPRPEPLVHVADRVGALGGETVFGLTSLEAEIPCG